MFLFGNEIVTISVNTKIKWYQKLEDVLLYIYICICVCVCVCSRNMKFKRNGRIVAMCEGKMLRRICGLNSE